MARLQELPERLQSILVARRARAPSSGHRISERNRRQEEIDALETMLKVASVVGRHADEFKVWFRLKTGHEF